MILDAARSLVASRRAARRVATPERLRPLDFEPFEAALAAVSLGDARHVSALVEGAEIASLARALDSGELSAQGLLVHHLSRVRALDDQLRSIIELNPLALDEARESDERRAAGASRGPLDGIPLTVKDNIATAPPLHTTAGTFSLVDHVADGRCRGRRRRARGGRDRPRHEQPLRARRRGVEHSRSQRGRRPDRQPRTVPSFSPGGSSSGTAVAVAAGLAVAGIGTGDLPGRSCRPRRSTASSA